MPAVRLGDEHGPSWTIVLASQTAARKHVSETLLNAIRAGNWETSLFFFLFSLALRRAEGRRVQYETDLINHTPPCPPPNTAYGTRTDRVGQALVTQ